MIRTFLILQIGLFRIFTQDVFADCEHSYSDDPLLQRLDPDSRYEVTFANSSLSEAHVVLIGDWHESPNLPIELAQDSFKAQSHIITGIQSDQTVHLFEGLETIHHHHAQYYEPRSKIQSRSWDDPALLRASWHFMEKAKRSLLHRVALRMTIEHRRNLHLIDEIQKSLNQGEKPVVTLGAFHAVSTQIEVSLSQLQVPYFALTNRTAKLRYENEQIAFQRDLAALQMTLKSGVLAIDLVNDLIKSVSETYRKQ